ncbi:MAG: hypothetical protein QOI15_448, partial [Pseudonocardiales bacterium]|nr:hypothetical protein [Pseudonocardiales bacterium]
EAPLTGCGFSVYLGVDIDLREHMPAQTVFSFATLDYNQLTDPLHDPETDFDYDQPWIWITSGTLNEGPRPGTDGYSSLEVTTFTPQNSAFWGLEGGVLDGIDYHRDPAYLEQKQRVEQAVVQAAIRTLPFLDGHIVWQESATMLSYEDWTSTRLGAWAGLDFSLPNLIFRPGPKTDINGLYLAGASSNSGGAILGTLLGGVATAGAILGRDLWRDVRSGAVYGHGLTDTGVSLPDVPAAGFHRLRVRGIQQQTPDSVVAELEVPEHLRETFAHEAGQHLTVRGASQGELLRRSYSICSPAGQDQLSIGVKHVPGGTFSTHAVTRLRIGDVLEVAPPQGRFTPPADTRHVAAVAAGSGVTPIYSIVATLFASQPDTTCTLLYGNRTADSIMFKQELAGLSRRYPGRLRVEHYLSRETEDGYHSGRVDGDAIAELAKELNADAWFVCGPAGLVEEAEKALVDSSVDPDRVHVERFDGVAGTAPVAVGRSTVRVTAGGSTDEFVMSRGDVILDAALSERDDMPYSCLSGSCGTCIAKLCAGSVEAIDDGDYALTAAEIADGLFLTCLARPTSDVVVVDFAR